MHFLDLLLEIVRILDGDEIVPSRDGIELHGMEIRRPDLVAAGSERFDRGAEHGSVEALMLGVGRNGKDLHATAYQFQPRTLPARGPPLVIPKRCRTALTLDSVGRAGHAADKKPRHVPRDDRQGPGDSARSLLHSRK